MSVSDHTCSRPVRLLTMSLKVYELSMTSKSPRTAHNRVKFFWPEVWVNSCSNQVNMNWWVINCTHVTVIYYGSKTHVSYLVWWCVKLYINLRQSNTNSTTSRNHATSAMQTAHFKQQTVHLWFTNGLPIRSHLNNVVIGPFQIGNGPF